MRYKIDFIMYIYCIFGSGNEILLNFLGGGSKIESQLKTKIILNLFKGGN
jgi:hypothetical protein